MSYKKFIWRHKRNMVILWGKCSFIWNNVDATDDTNRKKIFLCSLHHAVRNALFVFYKEVVSLLQKLMQKLHISFSLSMDNFVAGFQSRELIKYEEKMYTWKEYAKNLLQTCSEQDSLIIECIKRDERGKLVDFNATAADAAARWRSKIIVDYSDLLQLHTSKSQDRSSKWGKTCQSRSQFQFSFVNFSPSLDMESLGDIHLSENYYFTKMWL